MVRVLDLGEQGSSPHSARKLTGLLWVSRVVDEDELRRRRTSYTTTFFLEESGEIEMY